MTCSCSADAGTHLFCPECGKVVDRDGLRNVKLIGFTGRSSLAPGVERMYETGEAPG